MAGRVCRYDGCEHDLDGYPPASKYCSIEHAALAKRDQEGGYARRNRAGINLRRRNRESKRAREEGGTVASPDPEIRYDSGLSRPPLIDGVLRGRGTEYSGSSDPDEDPSELNWMISRPGNAVDFRASHTEAPGYDALGRPSRTRSPRAEPVFANPAALGAAVAPSSTVGRAMVHNQRHAGRFGPNVEPPAQVSGGHFESNTVLAQQEAVAAQQQAERQQLVSQHVRANLLPGRR